MAAAAAILALFGAVLAARWHSGFSNVDDYLYALQTRDYLQGLGQGPGDLVQAWRAYGGNSPLVPTLALPLAALDDSPHALVLVQLIPLAALVVGVRSLLGRTALTSGAAWVTTVLVAAMPPVLAYGAMYHFALAATACTTLAIAAYAASDGLARRTPALLLGGAVGVLLLSRVLAPVYVAALALPAALDAFTRAGGRRRRLVNGAAAAAVAAVVAAPWWLACGSAAWEYLTRAGYSDGAFTQRAGLFERVVDRLEWTAHETGWLLIVALLLLAGWGLICIRRRVPEARLLAVLLGTVLIGMLLLGSSTNSGTAFALPFVVVLACAAAAAAARLPRSLRIAAAAGGAAVVIASLLGLLGALPAWSVDGRPLWQPALPGVQQARAALGCPACRPPDSDRLGRQVMRAIGGRRTMLVRDDAVLNANGMRHAALELGRPAEVVPPPGDLHVDAEDLAGVDAVVVGSTFAPYHPVADPTGLAQRLTGMGFRRRYLRRLSTWNTVEVYRREPAYVRAAG